MTRPLVFVGPSAPREDITRWLPGAEIRPPIRRGDLYRARMVRYGAFLILDGVFMQDQAIPPREVVDVAADGATIIGAASMGALRAADCWPAGMLGVGSIYRRFRSGALTSDDEVAVAFDPEHPFPSLSVALVNVRHAVLREVQCGGLDAGLGNSIVAAAESTFYADRTWRGILDAADADPLLAAGLGRHDLKRFDAIRAMRITARLLEKRPGLLRARRSSNRPFRPSEITREQPHETLSFDDDPSAATEFLLWLIASGRSSATRAGSDAVLADVHGPVSPTDLHGAIEHGDAAAAARLLKHLEADDELDAAAFRFMAVKTAATRAAEYGWNPSRADRMAAASEIASGHGYGDFDSLLAALPPTASLTRHVVRVREELAMAEMMKRVLIRAPRGDGVAVEEPPWASAP